MHNRPQPFFTLQPCLLRPFAVRDVAGHRLEPDYLAFLQKNLHILADPHFAPVLGKGQKFVIGAWLFTDELPSVKSFGRGLMIGMNQLDEPTPQQFRFRIFHDAHGDRVHKGEPTRCIRSIDDVVGFSDQQSIPFLAVPERFIGSLCSGDVSKDGNPSAEMPGVIQQRSGRHAEPGFARPMRPVKKDQDIGHGFSTDRSCQR